MLRFDIAERPMRYVGPNELGSCTAHALSDMNHRHARVLDHYDLDIIGCDRVTIADHANARSNLGALRNLQLRQSVVLSAALAAVAVALAHRGALRRFGPGDISKPLLHKLKRGNDRAAAQVMSEVLQLTTECLPVGDEVLIESAITEGVRAKPGKEVGGNPTIPVGALFGKPSHQAQYGVPTPRSISLLSMGSDVVDGTTKSVMGYHSSLTALFVTEANVKRHLPDIYVQRWAAGAPFARFNPRETTTVEAAQLIADACGLGSLQDLTAFFLNRPRHHPAMTALNEAGVPTPYDQDGDLLPAVILGVDHLRIPGSAPLHAMIGEIGGSAEWAVGMLPLVWRGGHALGMLTSHSTLSRKDLSPEQLWKERFHFTEEEFIVIQDARFERKPYFTIDDIIDDPFAGGISAFGAITDNDYVPFMKGVRIEPEQIVCNTLVVDSLGITRCWQIALRCRTSLAETKRRMLPPKDDLRDKHGPRLERAIGTMLEDDRLRQRFRTFFSNEYYPALIPIHNDMVVLHKAIGGLIERGALDQQDLEIVGATERLAPEWFISTQD